MLCSNCHLRLSAPEQPCPQCGHQNDIPLNWMPLQEKPWNVSPGEQGDITFAVIGFVLPLLGLIMFLANSGTAPRKAQSALKGAAWGFGTFAVFSVLVIAALTALGSKLKQHDAAQAYLVQSSNFKTGTDVQFATDVLRGLLADDQSVGDFIDFDHFSANGQDMSQEYHAANAATQRAMRRTFIDGFSSRANNTPVSIANFSNWRIQSSNAGGSVVIADAAGGSLYLTIAYEQGQRKLYALSASCNVMQ